MIIDSHSHLANGRRGLFSNVLSPSELMDEFLSRGVEKAIVFTGDGFWGDYRTSNTLLAEQVKPFPQFYIPWATVHPYDGQAAVDEIRRCVEVLGMRGLKFHSWLQGFSVSSSGMYTIVEESIKQRIPITFHDGTPPYSSPLQIANLARLYPEATIILSHSGLRDLWPDAMIAAQEQKNIWLGLPGPTLAGMQSIVETIGADRILFGSDGGLGHPSAISYALRIINELKINNFDKEKILGLNIARLIHIHI
jgi:predicted TIM-barrel fold metal-dependent hydrolase